MQLLFHWGKSIIFYGFSICNHYLIVRELYFSFLVFYFLIYIIYSFDSMIIFIIFFMSTHWSIHQISFLSACTMLSISKSVVISILLFASHFIGTGFTVFLTSALFIGYLLYTHWTSFECFITVFPHLIWIHLTFSDTVTLFILLVPSPLWDSLKFVKFE
jgi:hypothetical protein